MRLRAQIAGVLCAVLLLGACTSWQVQSTPLPAYLAETPPPSRARLWLKDGDYVDLAAPRIVRDSVVSGSNAPAIAAADVTRYAVPKRDAVKTAELAGVVTVGLLASLGVFGSLSSGTTGVGY